jgi:hypothetical protein
MPRLSSAIIDNAGELKTCTPCKSVGIPPRCNGMKNRDNDDDDHDHDRSAPLDCQDCYTTTICNYLRAFRRSDGGMSGAVFHGQHRHSACMSDETQLLSSETLCFAIAIRMRSVHRQF